MKYFCTLSIIAALVAGLVIAAQSSSLLFKDTFDVSAYSTNLDFENNLRQSGSIGPLTYSKTSWIVGLPDYEWWIHLGDPVHPGTLFFNESWGEYAGMLHASPNHNFIDSTKLRIEVEINPNLGGDPAFHWAGLIFGADSAKNNPLDPGVMGVTLTRDGGYNVWDNGAFVLGGVLAGHQPGTAMHLVIDTDLPAWDGSLGTVNISLDGVSILSNYQRGFTHNYLSMAVLGFRRDNAGQDFTFDNLTVTDMVPEPGSVYVTAIGLAGLLIKRRRIK